jgi:hypothetical protein
LKDTGFTYAQLANDSTGTIVTGDINIQIYLTRIVGNRNLVSPVGALLSENITIQNVMDSFNGSHELTDHSILVPGQYTDFAFV